MWDRRCRSARSCGLVRLDHVKHDTTGHGPVSDPTKAVTGAWKAAPDIHGWGVTPWRVLSRLRPTLGTTTYPKVRRVGVSELPIIRPNRWVQRPDAKSDDEVRVLLYGEVMSQWRQLTDVRFRLMSMLPALSIVAFIPLLLLVGEDSALPLAAGVLLGALGLALTHGLHLYERRNDGLYDDLISRARRIEDELGVHTGIAKARLEPPVSNISHGPATRWIFVSVKLAWLVVTATLAIALVTDIVTDDGPEPPLRIELVEAASP
jgi:hypothetical protein